jgi:rhodanese-related sulfurtransferase
MGYTLGAPKATWRYVAVETISREEIKEKMDRGDDFVLVDTMAEMYYRHSHLPGAINVPVDELGERAPELLPDKHAEIIVYCIDLPCQASEEAASKLEAMGYGNVREYVGGKQDWIEHALPAEGRYYERRRQQAGD